MAGISCSKVRCRTFAEAGCEERYVRTMFFLNYAVFWNGPVLVLTENHKSDAAM